MLRDGGNAVDAAIAAAAVLNVVEPHMTGIGGDMFALLWSPEEEGLAGLDGSGRSGSLMTPEALAGENRVPGRGPGSVTVPGALAGWDALLDRYGTMSLAQVLAPAIRIATEGFTVTPIIARQWATETNLLERDAGATATFLPGGRAPEAGERFRNPDLAASLGQIADEGSGALYGGSLGAKLVRHLSERGGFLTLDDLATHEARWVDPISVDYHGYTVWELPPSGQGVAALQMLKILESFDLVSMGYGSPAYLHHLIEAKKLAYGDLARSVSDPDHMRVHVSQLIDPAYLAGRAELIDPRKANERAEPGAAVTDSETICLSTADASGMMVSFINSISMGFGSGVVVPGTGFALQNRGFGFTLEEGHANRVGPRKRPFHTIIPGFVTREGSPHLAFGLMGGSMQPQGHVQFLLSFLEFEMDLQEAIDAHRFRHMAGARVAIEGLTTEVAEQLRTWGHDPSDGQAVGFGGAQAVLRVDEGWAAGSDPRKDGMAVGY